MSSVKGFLRRRQRKRSKPTQDLVHDDDDMEQRQVDATQDTSDEALQEEFKEEVRVKEAPQTTQFSQEEEAFLHDTESASDVAADSSSGTDDTAAVAATAATNATSPPPPPFNLSPPNFSPASSSASSSNQQQQQQQLFHLERLLSQKDATIRQQSEELVATRLELQASRKQCQAHKQRAFDIQQKFLRWHKLLQDWMATSRTTAPPTASSVLLEEQGGNVKSGADINKSVEHRGKRQRTSSKERKEKPDDSALTITHAKLPPPPPVDEQRMSSTSATKKQRRIEQQPVQRALESETRSSLLQDSASPPTTSDTTRKQQESIRKDRDERQQRAQSNERKQPSGWQRALESDSRRSLQDSASPPTISDTTRKHQQSIRKDNDERKQRTESNEKKQPSGWKRALESDSRCSMQDSASRPTISDTTREQQQSIRKDKDERKQRTQSHEKQLSPQLTKQPITKSKMPKDTLRAHRRPMDPPAAMQVSQPSQRFDVFVDTPKRSIEAKSPAQANHSKKATTKSAIVSKAPVQANRIKPVASKSSTVSDTVSPPERTVKSQEAIQAKRNVAPERTVKAPAPVKRNMLATKTSSTAIISDIVAPERSVKAPAQVKRNTPATKKSSSVRDFSGEKQNDSRNLQTKKGLPSGGSSRTRMDEKLGGQHKTPVVSSSASNKENVHPNKNKVEARRVTMTPVRPAASPSSQSSSSTEAEETQTTQLDPRASIWCLPTTSPQAPASSRVPSKPTSRVSDRRVEEPNEVSKKQLEVQQHDSLHNATSQALLVEEEDTPTSTVAKKKPKSYSVAKALNGWRSTILAKSFVDEALDAAQVAAAAKEKKADEEESKRRPMVQNPYKKAKPSTGVAETRDATAKTKGAHSKKVESSKIASTWKTKKRRKSFAFDDADDYSQESPSQTKTTTDFKYQEVVRGKKQRQNLNGYSCEECGEFWETMVNGNEDIYNRKQFQNCSRHRAAFSPHNTPPGFWEMSFADEIRAREEEQRQKEMDSIRNRLLVREESHQAESDVEDEKACI